MKNKDTRCTLLAQVRDKRRSTAKKMNENNKKRCTAGLIEAAGQGSLNNVVLAYVSHIKEQEEAQVSQQQVTKKGFLGYASSH